MDFSRNDYSLCCLSTSFLLQPATASALSYCSLTAPAPRATYSRTVISKNQESSPPPLAFNRRQLLLSRSNREPAPMLKNGVPFLCCIMFILHSWHAPPRFLNRISFPFNVSNWFPQQISFNLCFETIIMN